MPAPLSLSQESSSFSTSYPSTESERRDVPDDAFFANIHLSFRYTVEKGILLLHPYVVQTLLAGTTLLPTGIVNVALYIVTNYNHWFLSTRYIHIGFRFQHTHLLRVEFKSDK
jgi:hypothetical protein